MLLVICLAAAAGCDRKDVQVLTRIGGTLADRAEAAVRKTPHFKNPLAVPPGRRERVLQRLTGDKALADTAIEVVETETGVRLLGTLPDERSKSIALELSRNTAGVDEVEDGLEVAGP